MHEFDKCLVMSKSGSKLAEGFVHDYEQDMMKICVNGEFSVFVPQETTIFVFNQIKGECVYTATVQKLETKNIIFNNIKFVRSMQKRDNTRVNKVLHYHITHKFDEDVEGDVKPKIKLDHPIEITVINISAQGMYFSCNQKFYVGYRFPLVFKDAGRPIELVIEVERLEDYNRSYNYGCRFVDISEKDMDNIFRFVLHEQIEQRRHNLLF